MTERACKKCHLITTQRTCPNCNTSDLSEDWFGLVVVLDPTESEVAKRLKLVRPGRYALQVR